MAMVITETSARRQRAVRVGSPSRRGVSRDDRRIRIEATEPTVARPPAGQDGLAPGQSREGYEAAGGRVLGDPLSRAQDAVGGAVSFHEGAVALEPLQQTEPAVEDLLDDSAALHPEVQRGANALRGERQALPGGVAHREEPARDRAKEPVRKVRAVVGGGHRAAITQEALEGGLELG